MIPRVLVLLLCFFYNCSDVDAYAANEFSESSPSHLRRAIVVDAGSSGSRLFVYCFPSVSTNGDSLTPVTLCTDGQGKPLTKKVNPGLSSFASNPSSAQAYIKNLLSFAATNIPKNYHSVTPLYIFATAGMRLLTDKQQDEIWGVVRTAIRSEYNFNFNASWAQTVSGYYEALFGWITVNYLLGNFANPSRRTAGMLDMGGASMQIAYEVPPSLQPPQNLILPFTIDDKQYYKVYVMTFLAYGTQATRSRYKSSLLYNAMEYSQYSSLLKLRYRPSTGYVKPEKLPALSVEFHYTITEEEKFILSDPCLQPGLEDTLNARDLVISRALLTTGNSSSPIITFLGTGNLTLCLTYQKTLLQKRKFCRLNPCSMNGIHQPPVDFESIQFYAMSEYWYTSSDFGTALSESYRFGTFNNSAFIRCKTPWHQSLLEYKSMGVELPGILNKQLVCFKAAWIMNVLHSGFGFPGNYANLHPVDQLSGIEVQWSLGALIYYMQLPEVKRLLTQEPDDFSTGFKHRQTTAILFFFLILIFLSISACCVYWRKRRQKLDFVGRRRALCCTTPFLLPFKRFWRSPKPVNNNGVGNSGSLRGGRRTPSGNYRYLKISSPSLQVNFRSSNSLPSFELLHNNNDATPVNGTV